MFAQQQRHNRARFDHLVASHAMVTFWEKVHVTTKVDEHGVQISTIGNTFLNVEDDTKATTVSRRSRSCTSPRHGQIQAQEKETCEPLLESSSRHQVDAGGKHVKQHPDVVNVKEASSGSDHNDVATIPMHNRDGRTNGRLTPAKVQQLGVTTVMVHNLPTNLTQRDLMSHLDEGGFEGCYDFLHLPCRMRDPSSVGYAFINFVSVRHAARCVRAWNRQFLPGPAGVATRKMHFTIAEKQGYQAYVTDQNLKKWGRLRNEKLRPYYVLPSEHVQ